MREKLSCFKSLTRNVVSDNDLFPITNIENFATRCIGLAAC